MAPLSYRRHRFPPAIIQHAIWLYLRFTLSYRDVEELLAERGLDVSYETVRRGVLKFGPLIARKLRQGRPRLRRSRLWAQCNRSLSRFYRRRSTILLQRCLAPHNEAARSARTGWPTRSS